MAFFNDNTILIMLFSSLVLKNTSERKFPTDMSKEKKLVQNSNLWLIFHAVSISPLLQSHQAH